MVLPPLLAGAVQVTVACALPAVAFPVVGAPGAAGAPATVAQLVSCAYPVETCRPVAVAPGAKARHVAPLAVVRPAGELLMAKVMAWPGVPQPACRANDA